MDPIINYRRLEHEAPRWRELELDYQPSAKVKSHEINWTVFSVAYIFVSAVFVSLLTVPDFEELFNSADRIFGILVSSLIPIALAVLLISRGNWKLALAWCAGIVFIPMSLGLIVAMVQFDETIVVLHVLLLFLVAYFVDRFAKHFYFWLTASHRIPSEIHRQRREWFNNRFRPSKLTKPYREQKDLETSLRQSGDIKGANLAALRAAEIAALRLYRRGLVFGAAIYLLLPYAYFILPFLYRGPIPVLLLFVAPPAIAHIRLRRLVRGDVDIAMVFRVIGHATVSWFTYGQNTEDVPGVFASPVGRRGRRGLLALITFFLLPTMWTYVELHAPDDMVVALGIGALLSPIHLLTAIVFAAGPTLLLAFRALNPTGARAEHVDTITDWEAYVTRLQASKTPLESEHLWLGVHPIDDFPVLLHRDILQEHAYIVGDSGSGKTALGVTPIVTQLIRQRHAAVVILDLKGDASFFQAARTEAERAGAKFKFFTNELNRSTHIFNPFGLADSQHISLNQLCETFLEALSLNHGEGYGRSYFSRMARHWLAGALRKNPNLESFEQLYEYTRLKGAFQNAEERERVFELISVIESLATFEQLNLTPARAKNNAQAAEHAILMPEVIREKQVVYFWLPAAVEAATVREIAKLALYSLMNAAYFFDRTTGDEKHKGGSNDAPAQRAQTYLVIDEFQRIASGNFKIILEQARSMGIGAILANQTFADLVTPESDLRPTVESNTRLKLCFSATDLDQQDRIIKASGETKDWQFGYSDTPRGRTFSFLQQVVPRIRRNNVIEISDDPFFAVCQIVRGSGYSQYSGYSIPIQTSHAISREEYQRRLAAPWPAKSEATIVVSRAPLPEKPFTSVEERLQAAQEAYKDADKPKPKETPAADKSTAKEGAADKPTAKEAAAEKAAPAPMAWAERLDKFRDSLYPKQNSSA